jgi:phage terminase large subunit
VIANDIKPFVGDDIVVCDSAEPKSIDELCTYGLSAVGARKGKDSILHGIQWLKKYSIFIDKSCQNTINNFKQYHWIKDRNGNVLNKPVDRFNDFIDALRYANEEHMIQFDDDIIEACNSQAAEADWDA